MKRGHTNLAHGNKSFPHIQLLALAHLPLHSVTRAPLDNVEQHSGLQAVDYLYFAPQLLALRHPKAHLVQAEGVPGSWSVFGHWRKTLPQDRIARTHH